MKSVFGSLLCSLLSLCVLAQQSYSTVEPEKLPISDSLTTTLLFPQAISKVSWCSPYFAIQQTREVGNVLEIKATAKDFSPSNLSVVTHDGEFYSFLLHYAAWPNHFTFKLHQERNAPVLFPDGIINVKETVERADSLSALPGQKIKRQRNKEMIVTLRNIYADKNGEWLIIRIKNKTNIPVVISSAMAVLAHTKKRTSIAGAQEVNINYSSLPLTIPSRGTRTFSLLIDPQYFSRDKVLRVDLRHPSGVSVAQLKLHKKHLRKIKPVAQH